MPTGQPLAPPDKPAISIQLNIPGGDVFRIARSGTLEFRSTTRLPQKGGVSLLAVDAVSKVERSMGEAENRALPE
jgi:hypothetical protein